MYRTVGTFFQTETRRLSLPGFIRQPIIGLKEVSMSKVWFITGSSRGLGRVLANKSWQRGTAWSPLPAIPPIGRSHRALW